MIEQKKHRQLMAVLSRHGLNDAQTRHELVYGWTGGRTASSKEMYGHEIDVILKRFENGLSSVDKEKAALELVKRDKRAAILAIATRVGFFPDGSSNFDYLNAWMLKNSVLKKELWKYTIDELDQLHRQFRGIEANFERSAATPGTKAWHIKNKIPISGSN
jgi:hypothetical protein